MENITIQQLLFAWQGITLLLLLCVARRVTLLEARQDKKEEAIHDD